MRDANRKRHHLIRSLALVEHWLGYLVSLLENEKRNAGPVELSM
jgi:hypothetical protein